MTIWDFWTAGQKKQGIRLRHFIDGTRKFSGLTDNENNDQIVCILSIYLEQSVNNKTAEKRKRKIKRRKHFVQLFPFVVVFDMRNVVVRKCEF